MFTSVRITSVDYYLAQNEVSRRESLQYYTDNGANPDEAIGTWWTPRAKAESDPFLLQEKSAALVKSGEAVREGDLRRLSNGRHPETNALLIQGNSEKRTVGYDCQLSMPKSGSVLWGLARADGTEKGRAIADAIEAAHRRANDRAMQYAYDQGLIVSRRGKGGRTREAAEEVMAAKYDHHTSRAGDPQLHTHNVLVNLCVRSDGTTGTLDNVQMLRYQGAIAAIYRAELASELKRTIGVTVSKDERNFRIDGVPDTLEEAFSKRRNTIEKVAAELGYDTAANREAAKLVNFATRQDKSEQPPLVELYDRWKLEAKANGHSFDTLLESVADAAAKKERDEAAAWKTREREAKANGEAIEKERPAFDFEAIKEKAFAALTEHNSTFEYRTLARDVFEELQVHVNANEAVRLLAEIEEQTELVRVGEIDGEPIFSTPQIIRRERHMLDSAMAMKGNVKPLEPGMVERVIAAGRPMGEGDERAPLRPEQANAVRHLLSGDQLTVMEGRAGAGKSFTLGAVTDAAKEAGFTVHGLAPSWKATGVLKEDTKLAEDYARAITGWLNRADKGEIALSPKTLILVDEAGMVGLDHMARLVDAAKRSGARLILSGDSRQLQPVAAGAPMAAIARLNGSAELAEIARQKVSWQRSASVDFSTGRAKEALTEYDKWGNVRLHDDGHEAMKALMTDYIADVKERPESSRLILASTNADATTLNNAVRAVRREEGHITGEEVTVTVLSRGKNGRPADRGFAAGDRVIVGETLTLKDKQFVNNSTGTLLSVSRTPEGEALFNIKWDDGRTLLATEKELVGYREENGDVPRLPKLAHAYAMTVHASQGQTVDKCYVYHGKGMGLESTYVAMTRHRYDARMYVDASRIADEIAAKQGRSLSIKKGSGELPQTDKPADVQVKSEEIRHRLYQECGRSEAKKNVCDFQADVREWVSSAVGTPIEPRPQQKPNEETTPMEEPVTPRVRGLRARFPVRPTPPEAIAPVSVQTDAGAAMRQRIEARATAERPRPVPAAPASRRITEAERDAFVRHDMRHFLIMRGLQYLEAYQPAQGGEGHILRHPDGGKVSIMRGTNGVWTFATRDGDQKGMIWDYVAWRDGKTRIEAMHDLRRDLRTTPAMPPRSYSPEERAKPLTLRQRIDEAMAKPFQPEAFAVIRDRWNRMFKGVNRYLASRGITEETQKAFASEIRTEGDMSRQNPRGVCFAHRDLDGNLTGYERKGPKHNPTDKRSFSQFASEGDRRLGLMGEREAPTRIYVSEVQIDGLSIYQADGKPKGALIASTYGTPSINGLADLYTLAQRHPQAEIHVAMDADTSGRAFAERIEEVIREARGPQATVIDRRPAEDFKDWNDQVTGKKWEKSDRESDEAKAAAEAVRQAARRAREEEERRRIEEARNRPRGPRL